MTAASRARENAESMGNAGDPRSRDRAVDQQHPRSCTGARPRPRRHLMTAASRARETQRAWGTRLTLCSRSVDPPGADFAKERHASGIASSPIRVSRRLRPGRRRGQTSPPHIPTTPLLMVGVIFNAKCDRAHRRPVATKIPEQEHPTGQDPRSRDRAVDQQHPRSCTGARPRPRRHLMTAASRARENAESMGTRATAPLMIGHRLMGTSLLCTGNIVEGRAHYNHALALYDPTEHRLLATRFGQDVAVATLSFRSLALWMLGYPMAALADAEQQSVMGGRSVKPLH